MTDDKPNGFITPLRVESVDAENWRLLSNLSWIGTFGDVFEVTAGEMTDFASVPWFTQWLIPRTGAWTKAAVLHDKMCNVLNNHYRWEQNKVGDEPETVVFNSVDTDGVFRKNASELGTDIIRAELLWVGVRIGALTNSARREGWLKTLPRFALDVGLIGGSFCVLAVGMYFTNKLL